MRALLYLENDLLLEARALGRGGTFFGELVFNTAQTGYQELITDPSYAGQFIVFASSQVGIVGVNEADNESPRIHAAGLIAREFSRSYSNFRAQRSLEDFLHEQGKLALHELNTRQLIQLIRGQGTLRAVISTETTDREELKKILESSPRIEDVNLSSQVSTREKYIFNPTALASWPDPVPSPSANSPVVAVLDYGVKRNILNELARAGARVEVYPHDTPAEELIELHRSGGIQGILLSNGPGEPRTLKNEIAQITKLIAAKVPMLGICLGHQLLSLAFGYETYKMKFGQHGSNHPVLNLTTGRVEISAQNHNYNVPEELCQLATITHRNLFGGNVEGLRYKDFPIISVQHHPESSAGPHEGKYIFGDFLKMLG